MTTVLYEEIELAVRLQVGISAQEILICKDPPSLKKLQKTHKCVLTTCFTFQ